MLKKLNSNDWQDYVPSLSEDQLSKLIVKTADAYYNGEEMISDEVYDALIDQLKEINPKSKVLKMIGAPIKDSVPLPYKLFSMDKVKYSEEKKLKNWINKNKGPYCLSDKLDGISCLADHSGLKLKLYTRGNGIEGKDISHILQIVKINIPRGVVARGEIIVSKKNFIKNYKKFSQPYKNVRNMVAGLANAKHPDVDDLKYLDIVFYELIKPSGMTNSEQLAQLLIYDKTVHHEIKETIDKEILLTYLMERKNGPYDIDGIIVTDNSVVERQKTGNPSYAIAFKTVGDVVNVKVKQVLWKIQGSTRIVPRVQFEPVYLTGVTVTYATAHNAKFIADNSIGNGSIITITRSGDVIPKIIDIIKSSEEPSMPDYEYEWDSNHVHIHTVDKNGKDVKIGKMLRFSKVLGIDNLSEGLITKLYDAGYEDSLDILMLSEQDLLAIPGFQKRLANKIYLNIQKSIDNIDLAKLMVGSYIFPMFGEKKIVKILDAYPNIVEMYKKKNYDTWLNKLNEIEGYDDISSENFLANLPTFQAYYNKVVNIINVPEWSLQEKNSVELEGLTFVFTEFRNKNWEQYIVDNGGSVKGSVSKNTTALIYAPGKIESAKYKKAQDLGIEMLTPSEFEDKYIQ